MSRGGHLAAELRDECLNGEIFYSLKEATVVIEQWRNHYNTIRPHSSLDYRPPAPRTSSPTMLHLDRSTAMQYSPSRWSKISVRSTRLWASIRPPILPPIPTWQPPTSIR